nr:leucine-rich repeat, immunoglobulin-like domain and transmembrane domain-containing protein 2 [Petromyzon marinus]
MLLVLLMLGVFAGRLGGSAVNDTCLLGCTCTSEGTDRSILCMAFKDRHIPAWLPADVTKLRVENSPLAEIPNQAFSSAPDLHSLWLNFNNITLIEAGGLEGLGRLSELRLRGNRLRSLPWTAFRHTPRLRLLDLRLNRLDALPEHALSFLSGLAYLDLSSNKLSVASSAVFAEWPIKAAPVAGVGGSAGVAGGGGGVSGSGSESAVSGSSVVLALHDNPWMCDCRLRGLVEFVRKAQPPVILMNSYITCAGPELRAGLFFHDLRLSPCSRPSVSLDKGNATVAVGREVSVRCTATGRPLPTVAWSYQTTNARRLQASVVQADEETLLSTLRVAPVLPSDAGLYACSASSFAGDARAGFSLAVAVAPREAGPPAPPAPPPARRSRPDHRGHLGPAGRTRLDLRVSKQGARAVTLAWTCVRIGGGGGFDAGGDEREDVWFSLHYGPADSTTKELVYIGPGVSTYSLSDLRPVTKYEACVLVRDAAPASRHGQCVTFVTGSEESSEMEQREKLIHVVVVVSAMLLIVPAGIFACTWDARAPAACRCAPPGCSCCGRRSLSTGVNLAQSRMGDGGVGKSGGRKMKKARGARWSRDEEEGGGGRGGGGVGGTAVEANAIPFDSLQAASDTELCRKEHAEQTLEGGRTKVVVEGASTRSFGHQREGQGTPCLPHARYAAGGGPPKASSHGRGT